MISLWQNICFSSDLNRQKGYQNVKDTITLHHTCGRCRFIQFQHLPTKMSILKSRKPQVQSCLTPPGDVSEPPRDKRKRVRFHDTAFYKKIPHLDDLGQDFIAAVYFQNAEYSRIADENSQVTHLILMSGNRIKESDDVTSRGLEGRMPHIQQKRKRIREDAKRAVLEMPDAAPEILSQIYMKITAPAMKDAKFTGSEDAKIAKWIADAPDTPEPKGSRVKSVSFARSIVVRKSLHLVDMTYEEIFNTWYQYVELKALKARNKKILMERDNLEEGTETIRGLEPLIPKNAKLSKETKICAIHAVLDEQDRQDAEMEYDSGKDEDLIAREYIQAVADAKRVAQKIAQEDQSFAVAYTAKDRASWEQVQKVVAAMTSSMPNPNEG